MNELPPLPPSEFGGSIPGLPPLTAPSSSRPPVTHLTRKQREVLTSIQRFSALRGYMPSVRELGKELGGLAPATVQHHLGTLRRKGYLEHDGSAHGVRLFSANPVSHFGTARPLSVTSTSAAFSEGRLSGGGDGEDSGDGDLPSDGKGSWGDEMPGMQVVLPLLGTIAAGRPLEATEETDEFIPVPASMARGAAFVLRVAGTSMIEDGIFDSDLIVVQPCERVENGQVAVVLLPDDTATLKRVHVEEGRIRLQPANSAMEPMFVTSLRIRGRVIGLVRQYS